MPRPSLPAFCVFAPPYRDFLPIEPEEGFSARPRTLRGIALVWSMAAGHGPRELELAAERPGGLPLMVILPPASKVRRLRERVLEVVEDARPQSILPYHPRPNAEEMAELLRHEPEGLPEELLDFLLWRGLPLDRETRRILRRTVDLSEEVTTLSQLARRVYLSRRALGRRFQQRGLPVPSHWLQFSRLLRATIRLQNSDRSVYEVARSLGYPDGFTLSNQMERVVGVRPSFARERLGWEWFAEDWLQQEWRSGGLTVRLKGMPPQDRKDVETPPSGRSRAGFERRGARRSRVMA